jgi:hypothetical protein
LTSKPPALPPLATLRTTDERSSSTPRVTAITIFCLPDMPCSPLLLFLLERMFGGYDAKTPLPGPEIQKIPLVEIRGKRVMAGPCRAESSTRQPLLC